jgi:hypothetical protein
MQPSLKRRKTIFLEIEKGREKRPFFRPHGGLQPSSGLAQEIPTWNT